MKSASLATAGSSPVAQGGGRNLFAKVSWAERPVGTANGSLEAAGPKQDEPVAEPPKKTVFGGPLVTFLVLAAPALWIGILVFLYGVDTPWGDQWDGTWPLLEKMQAGTLGLGDFFAFHNEHRIVFPRLIAVGLAKLTHWNVRAEMLIIWVLACICSLNLWRLLLVTGWRNSRDREWLFLAANVMLFIPLQWENFLWGFQIGFLLPLACLTACLWIGPSLRHPWNFLLTIGLCVVTTFSVASGFSCWLLTAPLLLIPQRTVAKRFGRIWWSAWLLIGAASVYLYFRGYARPAAHPSSAEALKHPFRAMQFVLAYLGTPFSSGTALDASMVASIAGAALLIPFFACLLYLFRWRQDRVFLKRSLPWALLAFSALINAFLTMIGRLGFGIAAAIQSRYISFAIMLPIGLLFLGALVLEHWRERTSLGAIRIVGGKGVVAFVTALSVLLVCGTIKSLEYWGRFQHSRLAGKAHLLLINIVDEPDGLARHVHQGDPALKARVNFLDRMGYLRPPLLRSNRIREIAFSPGPETMGELNDLGKSAEGEFAATGWAILPEKNRTADAVLLTYDDAQGEPIIFALADVGHARSDITRQLNDKAYLRSGWNKTWKAGQIPESSQLIRAWAFDAEDLQAFQIGAFSLDSPQASP